MRARISAVGGEGEGGWWVRSDVMCMNLGRVDNQLLNEGFFTYVTTGMLFQVHGILDLVIF